jgi:penicillin V acylase-like amidase (Ntn superfamily)
MDFPPRTPWHLTYLPQGYAWRAAGMTVTNHNHYAMVGGMRVIDHHYLVGDAFNAAGLACAELFFPVAATYPTAVRPGTQGLTPQDFVMWVVGQHHSVQEVANDLANVTVIDALWYDQRRYPFHWLLMDQTGTYVIEPLGDLLRVRPNPLAVFTNTPALNDQLGRLARFLHLPETASASELQRALATTPFSAPRGGNSVQRFIQGSLWRWQHPTANATSLYHFLTTVTVPHVPEHAHNYTHYQAVINLRAQQYDFHDLHSGQVISQRLPELIHRFPQSSYRFK